MFAFRVDELGVTDTQRVQRRSNGLDQLSQPLLVPRAASTTLYLVDRSSQAGGKITQGGFSAFTDPA